jgi:GMP synthase (glutamine-hydrolysing)
MEKEILVIRNTPRENPGMIEILLNEHNLKYVIIDYDNTSIIKSLEQYSAIIVLGGPESANDRSPKMISELALIRKAIEARIPYLGICLGLQTFVKAMGGEVVKSPLQEVGFHDPDGNLFHVDLTPEGRKDRLFDNLPDRLNVFQLHGEMVIPSKDMTLLATGKFCDNQVVKYANNAYGIQSHFELTDELLDCWIDEDTDLRKLDSAELRADFNLLGQEYYYTGRQLFSNFLSIANLNK